MNEHPDPILPENPWARAGEQEMEEPLGKPEPRW